ncbi:dynein regulatory complex subunit 2 [Oryzias melastigma]|uniref:Dynein regulatory complex subunit 2 n=1 Tax=Oryzias melastigma TaxID=30732 RepID=A0A3B3CD83_ORYME|nr:dynein regulatory complex subunit 2 [Oryzias melastigma]
MPKKAKKSLGRTEEERLVQLQHRVQAEEEMSKKKEEMLTLFLKDKLQKEQKNTAVNLLKVTDRWRSLLRQARVAELRGNISVFQQTFEREVDELDFITEKLVGDLQGAERQTAQVQASHLQHLDHLLAQDLKRMKFLHQHWGGNLQDLSSSSSSEKQQMFVQSEEQQDKLQSKVESADQHHKDTMQEIKNISTERESWFSTFSDSENVQVGLGDTLHESISTVLRSLKQNINSLKKNEEELALRLDHVTQQLEITLRLKSSAEQLRDRLRVSEREKEFMEENLTSCRNQMNLRFYQAQGQEVLGRLETKEQLLRLAVQGDAAAEKLQATIAQGEKVLRAAKMGLKLKHEVLPQLFAPLHLPPEEHTQDPEDDLDLQQHLSKALLQREALREDKDDVSRENVQLQLLLEHEYGLHEDCSPLPTSQAPIIFSPAAGHQHHTVIEAAHIAKYCL